MKTWALFVLLGGAPLEAVVMAGPYQLSSAASESLQIDRHEPTKDETVVMTPVFMDFVLPITWPFAPEVDVFNTTLFSPQCG